MNFTRDRNFLLYVYCLLYYAVLFFFFLDQRLLSQLHPVFLTYNRDLTEIGLISTGIPAFIMVHSWAALVADGLIVLLPVLNLVYIRLKGCCNPVLGVVFSGVLSVYLLLINLFWQADHEPFMLYLFLSVAFWTNRPERFYAVLRFCRYYFCYVFASAAIWKLARGSVFYIPQMSHILLMHQADLLTGPCDSFWCGVTRFLIGHPVLSWGLYAGAVALELLFVAGFFTRRWDRLLIAAAVLFVAADMWLMRIPYWTLLIGCVTLYLDVRPRRAGGIVIYETTHHENLPGLLDLCGVHFEKTAVFLRRLSFDNLSGDMDPQRRWPGVLFVVQEEGVGNRVFIVRLFRFLRKDRGYTHLHLSTLDSNWLLFALYLFLSPDRQVSMTVHAVNDYFTWSAAGVKAVTESLAKWMLHRRIGHYLFFLPGMAEQLRRRMSDAVAVAIPSRFYRGNVAQRPEGAAFIIVIPGSVDPHRRDYPAVIAFFRQFLTQAPLRTIELVLLGNSGSDYGKDIVAQLRQFESGRFRLTVFDGYVPEDEYERRYATADLIWAPLQPQKTSDDRPPEVYGRTIASGLTADLQLGHTPVLAPDWLMLPLPYSAALIPYSSLEKAGEMLRKVLDEPTWRQALSTSIDHAFLALRRENYDADFRRLTRLDDSTLTITR
ncbi:MAG TPA: hypothetical protein VHE34_14570 [Puia sp.]|uniref:hypothetical protein n=1 Tax=Puia sp. TaxID=2045100 RepID=UPI002B93E006|nr:hypothetical protein [Puia sp.]HVU96449.1 hypothetical protein [Puia sp.]